MVAGLFCCAQLVGGGVRVDCIEFGLLAGQAGQVHLVGQLAAEDWLREYV